MGSILGYIGITIIIMGVIAMGVIVLAGLFEGAKE
jgi:hypothetical protein